MLAPILFGGKEKQITSGSAECSVSDAPERIPVGNAGEVAEVGKSTEVPPKAFDPARYQPE